MIFNDGQFEKDGTTCGTIETDLSGNKVFVPEGDPLTLEDMTYILACMSER